MSGYYQLQNSEGQVLSGLPPGGTFSSGTGSSTSSSRTGIVPGMLDIYNQLLGLNVSNYNNILSAYSQEQNNLQGQFAGLNAGYRGVEQNVMDMLGVTGHGWGVAQPAATAIRQGATFTSGQIQQQMINAGLGNSTALGNLENQSQQQTGIAYGDLGAKLADRAATAEQDIGLARLSAQGQGYGIEANLAGSFLGDVSRFNFNPGVNLLGTFSNSRSSSNQVAASRPNSNLPGYGGGGGGYGGGGSIDQSLPGYGTSNPLGYYSQFNEPTPSGLTQGRTYGGSVGGYMDLNNVTSDLPGLIV